VKILTFQVTARIGPLQGDPKRDKERLGPEPKEGGKVKSYKNCPGHTGNLVKVEVFIGRFVGSCLMTGTKQELRSQTPARQT
jgi:hypothetical protein